MTAMRAMHVRRLTFLLVLAGLLTGCGGGVIVAAPTPLQPIEQPRVQPAILWTSDGGEGTQGETVGFRVGVDAPVAYVANHGGNVAAFAIRSGQELWRVETGKKLISGPTVAGDVLLVGTRDGHLLALSSEDGHKLWQVNVSSQVIASPAAYNGIVVVRTLDGRIVAYELASGKRLWTVERAVPKLTVRGASSPLIADGRVYAGLDNGEVVALDLATGRLLWEQTIALPTGSSELERLVDIDAELLLVDNTLYAASVGNKLASLSVSNGRVRWKQDIGSVTGLAFNRKLVFTTDLDGVVYAVNRLTGEVVWKQEALKYRELSAPVMYNGYVVVGDYQGYLHWLDPQTGRIVGRIDVLDAAIRTRPVVVGNRILVLGVEGELAAVRATAVE